MIKHKQKREREREREIGKNTMPGIKKFYVNVYVNTLEILCEMTGFL